VRLDALSILVEDRTDREVAFEVLEGLFDGDELTAPGPEKTKPHRVDNNFSYD